ncbi:MAG TPA: pseudouridylate synthase [Bacteroidales bacterium]|nr:pseudouridylate synthase [Bacteroidales bacterium]HPS70695.1 pseudouridylate synthase [Bacteroidales bacterium]
MPDTHQWNFAEINVLELLPQQQPFVFVDQIVSFKIPELSCITQFQIKETTLLVKDGCLSESGIIENIAQTCAVHIGFYNKYILNKKIQVGFIGAVKNLRIFDKVQIGDQLITTIAIKTEFGSMKIADATVEVCGKRVAEGELKIALQE